MMNLLDITLDPGIYLGYPKNNNIPTTSDLLVYDESLELYTITIPTSDLTYTEIDEGGTIFELSYYKIFYVKSDGSNIASASIPIWKDVVENNNLEQITIYLDKAKMEEGKVVGAGDDTKLLQDWYFAGNWGAKTWDEDAIKFERQGDVLVATINKEFEVNEQIYYKIKPSPGWQPWHMIFNGEVYSNDSADAVYTLKSDIDELTVKFYPKISYIEFEEK
jgi:hypothetical protein